MLNRGCTFRDRVPRAFDGRTVLDYYVQGYRQADSTEWRRRIDAGLVTRDGCVLACDQTVREGDRLEYRRPPWEEPDVPLDAPILFQDADVVVFDKPAGLPVTPGAGCQDHTLLGVARRRFGEDVRPVHRLDTGTSGAVAFARSAEVARHLCRAFAARRVGKTYLARVVGADLPDRFAIDLPIGPVPYPPKGFVSGVTAGGRSAFTEVVVLRREPGRGESVVEVRIATGRSQQIRVHLAWAGFPLAGDPVYGVGGLRLPGPGEPPANRGDGGYLLHAWRLRLPSRGGAAIEIVAPPPADLEPGTPTTP